MNRRINFKKQIRPRVMCRLCGLCVFEWPRNGVVLENETGTEQWKCHIRCADAFIKKHGAKVIDSNVGHD